MKKSSVYDCSVIELKKIHNRAGNITIVEEQSSVPFPIERIYYLYDIPGGEERGGHAHKALQQLIVAASGSFDITPYLGTYKDTWFGDIQVSNNNGKAWLASKRSPKLKGELFPYKGNTLIVRWTDRSMDADAFVMFTTDMDGKPSGMTMKAISPLTDFSFDFQDLDLKRVK